VADIPKRSWLERFGPALACLVLILLLSVTAWWSLTVPPAIQNQRSQVLIAGGDVNPPVTKGVLGEAPKGAANVASATDATHPESNPATVAANPAAPGPAPAADTADAIKIVKVPEAPKPKVEPLPVVPSGSAGLAEKPDGLFLRFDLGKRLWDRLSAATPLNRSDRLLCLAPFRASITLGRMRVTLVGETEVRILSSASDAIPSLELLQGQLLIHQVESGSLKVVFSKRTAGLELQPESTIALQRVERATYGRPVTQPPPLAVVCVQGSAQLSHDGKEVVLKPSNLAMIDGAQIEIMTPESLPVWAAQAEPSPYELEVRKQFLTLFHPDRNILTEIVGAIDDPRPEMKQLAISALKALGDLSYLRPLLSREGDPVTRRKAIESIRSYMALNPDSARYVQSELNDEFGDTDGATAYRMLVGYSAEDVAKGDAYPKLVGLLSADHVAGIRELALDTLKHLTGRDSLGYDPDHPTGKGLDNWNDLLRRDELKAPPPRAAKTKAKTK
jgi:hypothetical protein